MAEALASRAFTAEDAEERGGKPRQLMDEFAILNHIDAGWDVCQKCPKYIGALTAETIRQALRKHGIPVSARDVFIRGIPIEFDLIVPRHDAPSPVDGILFELEDVIAVLEIKASGLFDYNSKNRILKCFEEVQQRNHKIFCCYVTLSERQSFHETNFGEIEWAYPLFWWRQLKGNEPYQPTGAWQKLLSKLHSCIENTR